MFFPDRSADSLGPVLLSASDLRAAAACEYAMLTDLDVLVGRRPDPQREPDQVMVRAAELGVAHEQRHLLALTNAHPGRVRTASSPARTRDGYEAAFTETLAHLADPEVAVVHQACVYDGDFLGFVDFLVRDDDGRWVVSDTKLARRESVAALLQVAAYAEVLRRAGVDLAPVVRLVLGDDEAVEHALADVLPVLRARRRRLDTLVARHLAETAPTAWGDERWEACLRCDTCQAELEHRDDSLLVAGVHLDQRGHLGTAGVTTVPALAELADDAEIPGIRPARLARMRAQARLQLAARGEGDALPFEVHEPSALAAIPASSPGDVFFDFEGDPMYHEPGSDTWGLEYLFGALVVDEDGTVQFTPFWAHSRAEEGQALVDFLDWLHERRRRWPDLHVYHYADYERSALLRLAARHGVGQEQVDGLLRDGVLVDLYSVVRSAVRVGTGSYSIKRLEPLYMGEQLRDSDGVTGGGDSIVEYHRYAQAELEGQHEVASERLESIREYNEYDCLSTLRLRDWLRARAVEHGITPIGPGLDVDPDEHVEDPHPLEMALREVVGDTPAHERTPEQQALSMLASAVQYHRREAKPYWWGHYDRLRTTVDEWARGTDVYRIDDVEVVAPWLAEGRKQPRRRLRLTAECVGGPRNGAGQQLEAIYHDPVPAPLAREDQAGATRDVTIVEVVADDEECATLLVEEAAPRTGTYDALPVGLGPTAPVSTDKLAEAITYVAQVALDAQPEGGPPALPDGPVFDLLARRRPRLGGATLPRSGDDVADVLAALLRLDRSYLAVQGPPGTGKTYVGAQVIARLVREHGWRVGVVAQSHAAIENMLDAVVSAGVPGEQVGKRDPRSEDVRWRELGVFGHADFAAEHHATGRGYVIGGTAWDLTHPKRVERAQLDLVVVDEAGQYSLAATIACSVAADRLLLLGDPQQLPQVSQGTHPDPVDRSALGWLLDGAATMPASHGYFLETTWRMHPDLTAAVSTLSYAGQLHSRDEVTTARTLDGIEPGVHVVRVEHVDRTTSSPEEAAAIVELVRDLRGRMWTSPDDESTRGGLPLRPEDVLVVTAYNHQVRTINGALAAAGLDGVRVGTVDKIQGQQAPVVVLSMAASAAHEVGRGLGFLLERNRLNVAMSRAQHAAFVVMSPRLLDAAPGNPRELVALGAFMGLVEDAREWAVDRAGQLRATVPQT